MIAQLTGETGLWALFASAFISSTLLPGGSEVLLLVLATQQHYEPWLLLAVASAGNTLGGMSSWGIGRMVAWRFSARGLRGDKARRAIVPMQRWGSPLLLLSWLPVLGDPLCLAAGWLRVAWWSALLFIALGKCGRYAALLAFT